MNEFQRIWLIQAQSDFDIFEQLRRSTVHECHLLHFLQMSTEKIAKAYLWRNLKPPPRVHSGFSKFLRYLAHGRGNVHKVFEFTRFSSFQIWITSAVAIAREIEQLAPSLASGPNPEYPWPHDAPVHAPAAFRFNIWNVLQNESRGRVFLKRVKISIQRFPEYCHQ